MKITMVDTKFNEMQHYNIENLSLSFIIGRDLPNIVVILSEGKEHKAYCLNDVFDGTGCEINKFENWFKGVIVEFDKDETRLCLKHSHSRRESL